MQKLLTFLVYAGFGLLPLWMALFAVHAGGQESYVPSDYWNTAPWLIVLAIPACAITLGIVGIASAISRKRACGTPAKAKTSKVFVLVAILLAITFGVAIRGHHETPGPAAIAPDREERNDVAKFSNPLASDEAAASELALQFVQSSHVFAEAPGTTTDARFVSTTMNRNGGYRYRFYSTDKNLYAIVDNTGTPAHPTFVVACTTGHLPPVSDSYADDCGR